MPLSLKEWKVDMKTVYKLFVVSLGLWLVGCGGAVPGKSPTLEFRTANSVQVVFDRAMAQAKYCWSTDARLPIVGNVAANGRKAEVRSMGQFGRIAYGRVDIEAVDANTSFVSIAVIGVDEWNESALPAMKDAIEFGVPSCTAYFPSEKTGQKNK
jgi:hypothetical protein